MKVPLWVAGVFGKGERGFTLPEVLVTTVIMGILFTIATSSWLNVTETRKVDSATNQFKADLRIFHGNATNRLAAAQLVFSSTGAATFDCNSDGRPDDYCLVQPTPGGASQTISRSFEDNVTLNSPNLLPVGGVSAVEFAPDGSASSPGAIGVTGVTDDCPAGTPTAVRRLQVTIDGNPAHCLTYNATTSRIRVD